MDKQWDEILEELENDPETADCQLPEEWDADFRKTIEDCCQSLQTE